MSLDFKQIVTKNTISSLVSLPISFGINISLLPFFLDYLKEDLLIATIVLSIPFVAVSIIRLTLIDVIWKKYNIHIDPAFHLKKLINKGRHF